VSKLVVASTFPVYPPRAGGQLRIFHLYRELARHCSVDIVSLVERDQAEGTRTIETRLRETRISKTAKHADAEAARSQRVGIPVTDIAFAELHHFTPAFGRAVAAAAEPGSILVASHPYALPAMRTAARRGEWWYDAHNVEADLKAQMLPASHDGEQLLTQTRSVERECCRCSALVLVTCAEDGERLGELYGVAPERIKVVPNAVDTSHLYFVPPSQRRAQRVRLRLNRPMALFIGSWHEPNLVAARAVISLAARLPNITFAIVGSVGIPLASEPRTDNVELFGPVGDELKRALLGVAEVALNPMLAGSGTNMKMLDYLSAGIPVVSTQIGIRGLTLNAEEDLKVRPYAQFADTVVAAMTEPPELADERAVRVRNEIEQRFSPAAAAAPILGLLRDRADPSAQIDDASPATSA
jgi:glycosyltransferase involved in cell wall biosynthesis